MRTRNVPTFILVVAAIGGCSATAGSPGSASRDLITAQQITASNAQTAWEAVERLQPQWLTSRGATSLTNSTPTVASVFLNGVQVGDIEYLKRVNATDVKEMRYYPPGQAGARFGMGHQRGVIDVTTNGPAEPEPRWLSGE